MKLKKNLEYLAQKQNKAQATTQEEPKRTRKSGQGVPAARNAVQAAGYEEEAVAALEDLKNRAVTEEVPEEEKGGGQYAFV